MAFLRTIPSRVIKKLRSISTPTIRIACVLELSKDDIEKLGLSRLGIKIEDDSIIVPSNNVFPDESFGQVAHENIHGKEIIDKESPKIDKDIYFGERPIYGDWSNGSFSLWQTKKVYRKDSVPPRGYSLNINSQSVKTQAEKWKVTFSIEPVLDRNSTEFNTELIFTISLLREVTGNFDVFASDVTTDEIANTRIVSWEIFPPGKRDLKTEVDRRLKNSDERTRKIVLDRAGTIESLKPLQYILGSGLASNYYGALFANDLVVFENLDYGNATYILYENWQELSKLSRTELLKGYRNFDRIIHDTRWADQLTHIINHEIKKRRHRK